MRDEERLNDQLRHVKVETEYIKHPEGSVLISFGDTKVICSASVEDRVPPFMRGQGKGWITAEYAMLPRATEQRTIRESSKGKVAGRTMEIQRLIGRALRSVVDLDQLGERTVWIDCDVIQADGGTRTASITGAFIAVGLAFETLMNNEKLQVNPLKGFLAAISVGVDTEGQIMLDLDYNEDSQADVDMNVVMTDNGDIVEIQGTGEEATFTRKQLNTMLDYAEIGVHKLVQIQKESLGSFAETVGQVQNMHAGAGLDSSEGGRS
ncbi:ribonuclease PH [Salisediminibacterium halotolerans]|uniref:Ribonuclease PH n=1 Tax=Salisediminibacterium halotolerans TaxID=517425 RepID=A0A1H9U328_9BACI|nr:MULTISPECIES: ribonuclease PH [Salisediminibacterium]RLJ81111.1 RNAse PH [Actinophytocola xinjiangensis]RPE84080.1 RNAse PH [Salisediminibacterium halotolerans]TWG38538.1 RNAse PH [Salisediminibacterium halotolerans]SES03651.1 ribonuclease PH [Salisediminibacterium haloalkalitolerans]GEL07186.1 ribonuclease PH [Salisediminibacterium halotolerans]